MEGQHVAVGIRRVGLMPDALARGQLDRARVAEAAHAAQRAEIVIEGAVLLHHEDDVLDVVDGAGAVVGRNREARAMLAGNAAVAAAVVKSFKNSRRSVLMNSPRWTTLW